MKALFFLIQFTCFCALVKASDSLVLRKSIPMTAFDLTTDPLGNIYLLKEKNTLTKLNENGDSLAIFNEIRKGKNIQIDASNPLRTLMYFSDYGNILVLDNLLSLKMSLKLFSIGILNAPCIASSIDGGIWIFDPLGNLIKMNERLEKIFTVNLQNTLEEVLDPIYMIEQERNLYVVDRKKGIFMFDQFGMYKINYPFQTQEIQYINSYLIYFQKPYLYSYDTRSFVEKKLILPSPENIIKVRVEKNKVYILRFQSLEIYDFI